MASPVFIVPNSAFGGSIPKSVIFRAFSPSTNNLEPSNFRLSVSEIDFLDPEMVKYPLTVALNEFSESCFYEHFIISCDSLQKNKDPQLPKLYSFSFLLSPFWR